MTTFFSYKVCRSWAKKSSVSGRMALDGSSVLSPLPPYSPYKSNLSFTSEGITTSKVAFLLFSVSTTTCTSCTVFIVLSSVFIYTIPNCILSPFSQYRSISKPFSSIEMRVLGSVCLGLVCVSSASSAVMVTLRSCIFSLGKPS